MKVNTCSERNLELEHWKKFILLKIIPQDKKSQLNLRTIKLNNAYHVSV